MKQPGGHHPGQAGGNQYANGRQRQRRAECHAKGAGLGAHPAVQQNHRQREVTHHVGEGIIIEWNTADAVDARKHADGQEDNKDRYAETR
ncbi:hypothetical protein D3C76_1282810 [compost metagenome]